MEHSQLARTHAMLTWLRAAGAEGLDNVEVKETAYGGLGVFLAAPVETTSIARIPVECCVTAAAALTRPVGRAAREILPDCADEFVLVLDAATGRRDQSHPQHAYLASLPAGAQHVATFPKDARRLLKGTALGDRVERERREVRAAIGNLLPQLRAARPDLFGELSAADVRWAREMVVTRAFRAEILNGEGGACGVLCPLLDLRNHADGAVEATPRASDGHVRLCAPGIDVGAEIVTNYGEVSNADHLMSHGFALRGSTHETFALSVADGVFDIREAASDDDQFPHEMFEAFEALDPRYAEEEPVGAALAASTTIELSLTHDPGEDPPPPGEDPPCLGTGERAILTTILLACRAAVRPFDETCHRDKSLLAAPGPEAAVATYRLGQWRILNDAIHILEWTLRRRKRRGRMLWEERRRKIARRRLRKIRRGEL